MRTRVAVALRATIIQCFVSVSLKASNTSAATPGRGSPTPREADVLTQVLEQIKAENFEHASELLNTINQAIVASSLVTNTDQPAVGPVTTRELRNQMREIRIHPI